MPDGAATVQLFATCLVDVFTPRVGRAVVGLLEDHGLTVEYPFDQTCCGQPAFNLGRVAEARAMAEHTIEVLDATDGLIIVPSGSCAAMIVEHYETLLPAKTALAAAGTRVANRVREFTQFLVDDLGLDRITSATSSCVVFHPSCHGLRRLHLDGYGERVLDAAGVDRRTLHGADECCGFGGLFAVEMPGVSSAIMDTKLDNVEAAGAQTLVGYDSSCLMHMAGGLRRRGSTMQVSHIAEVLRTVNITDDAG